MESAIGFFLTRNPIWLVNARPSTRGSAARDRPPPYRGMRHFRGSPVLRPSGMFRTWGRPETRQSSESSWINSSRPGRSNHAAVAEAVRLRNLRGLPFPCGLISPIRSEDARMADCFRAAGSYRFRTNSRLSSAATTRRPSLARRPRASHVPCPLLLTSVYPPS